MSQIEHLQAAPEDALLLAAQAGDQRAFASLLDRHRGGLKLYCYLMAGDQGSATDVMRNAVQTAWRERGFVGPQTDPRMWLYRVMTRVSIEAADGGPRSLGPTAVRGGAANER